MTNESMLEDMRSVEDMGLDKLMEIKNVPTKTREIVKDLHKKYLDGWSREQVLGEVKSNGWDVDGFIKEFGMFFREK